MTGRVLECPIDEMNRPARGRRTPPSGSRRARPRSKSCLPGWRAGDPDSGGPGGAGGTGGSLLGKNRSNGPSSAGPVPPRPGRRYSRAQRFISFLEIRDVSFLVSKVPTWAVGLAALADSSEDVGSRGRRGQLAWWPSRNAGAGPQAAHHEGRDEHEKLLSGVTWC